LIESPTINSPEKFTSGDAAGDHANFCSARPGCRITSADGRTVISISLRCFDSCFLRGQAALLGLRGIAINAPVTDSREPNFTELEPHVSKVIDLLLAEEKMSLVNMNLPEKPKGIRWTRQSVRHYDGKVVPARTRWGTRFFGLPSRHWKEPRKGPTAGRSSIIGYQSLLCVSISPTKRISRAPYRLHKRHQ
jgi:hypothetical protein